MKSPRRVPLSYDILFAFIAIGTTAYLVFAPEKPWDLAEKLAVRSAEGKLVPVRWHMVIGLWWGCLLAGLVAAGLLSLRSWLATPYLEGDRGGAPRVSSGLKKLVTASAAAATIASFILNTPRTTFSLWGDEEASLRKAIMGEFVRGSGSGQLEFHHRPWRDTFFNYRTPNNHVPLSVLSRLSHTAFGPTPDSTDPTAPYFSEFAIRLPATVAGLLAIGAWAWCIATFGFPRAAAILPWLLVLHPWFVRYSTEARGYALVFLTEPLFLTAGILALRTGRWRWWALFSAAGFATFYSYPGTVYFLVSTYAAVAVSAAAASDWTSLRRTVVSGAASTIPVFILMTPLFPQLQLYLSRDLARGEMGASWLVDASTYLTTGSAWFPWDATNPLCIAWESAPRAAAAALFVLFCALTVAGAARLATASHRTRIFLAVFLLPPVLTYWHNAAAGTSMYRWYLLPALPLIVALWAIGAASVTQVIRSRRWRDPVLLAAALAVLGFYGTATSPQRSHFRSLPIEPSRDAVALTRSITNPFHPDYDSAALTASFHMGTPAYDPGAYRVHSAAELEDLISRAESHNIPFHVHFAQPGLARQSAPEIFTLLENPTLFTALPPFPGMDEQCTRYLFRGIR